MKILYGVVGEGMGHAMRSRVVLEHLISRGHEVEIMASQRAVDYLSRRFPQVRRIHGMHIITEENRVRRGKTLWANVQGGIAALPAQIKAYYQLVREFRPEAVISDFESWTYLYAKRHGLPILSVDNNQMLNRCLHPKEIIDTDRTAFEVARAFVKSKLPFCDHYFIASFFYPPLRKERTTLHPPILRPEILSAAPSRGDHLLVYQTAEGHRALVEALVRTGLECRIYGMHRGLTQDRVEGRLRYRPFDETTFIEDLASARGVIAGGGFTLVGECVYLKKPVLSVPISGQFEQRLNALYVERAGYGRCAAAPDERAIREFLDRLPAYEERLSAYRQDGNQDLLAALDARLGGG